MKSRISRLEERVFTLEGRVSSLQTELGYTGTGGIRSDYKHPPFATVYEMINLLLRHLGLDIVRVNAYKKIIPIKGEGTVKVPARGGD